MIFKTKEQFELDTEKVLSESKTYFPINCLKDLKKINKRIEGK